MGEGNIGIDKVVAAFAERCPDANLNLEIITGRPPDVLNYLEPEFWKGFEKVKAGELARFVALGNRGQEFHSDKMAPNDPEQQRADLERSMRYCRERLGVSGRP